MAPRPKRDVWHDPLQPKGRPPYLDLAWAILGGMVAGERVLVFCGTRKGCQDIAMALAALLGTEGYEHLSANAGAGAGAASNAGAGMDDLKLQLLERRTDLIETVGREDTAASRDLKWPLNYGVAFHHAGLGEGN